MLKCLPGLKACNAQVEYIDRRNCGLTAIPTDILKERNLEECLLDGNLISEIPPVFFLRLSRLRRWCMSENALRDVPAEIAHLRELCEIDLSKNFIQHVHPNVRYCALLQRLDLSVNPIGRLPEQICDLRRLTHLKLNEVELLELPFRIGEVRNLVVLELRENLLDRVPDSVCLLTRLQSLDIGSNQLRSLPEDIGELTNLVELFVDSNLLGSLPESIGELVLLQQLDASGNKLRRLPYSIGQLTALTDLNVADNKLTELPAAVGRLRHLLTLKAERNRLVTLPPELGACSALREIVLAQNQLIELPETVRGWSQLTNLSLDRNRLRYLPNELCECTSLELLSVAENQLAWIPNDLGALSRLHVLNLAGNRLIWLPVSLEGLTDLKACWLSEQQSAPLVAFERQLVDDIGDVLTCSLLPQPATVTTREDGEQPDDAVDTATHRDETTKDECRSLSASLTSSARETGGRKKNLRFLYEPQIVRENRNANRPSGPHPGQVREQQLLLMRAHALSVRRAHTAANRLLSDSEEPQPSPKREQSPLIPASTTTTAAAAATATPAPAAPTRPAKQPPEDRIEKKDPYRRISRTSRTSTESSNPRTRRISNMSMVLQRIKKMSVQSNTFEVDSCQITNWRIDNRQFDQLELAAHEEAETEADADADGDAEDGYMSPIRRLAHSFSVDTAFATLDQLVMVNRFEDADLDLSLARNRRISSAPELRTAFLELNTLSLSSISASASASASASTVSETKLKPPKLTEEDAKVSEFDDSPVRNGDRVNTELAIDSITLSSFSTEVDDADTSIRRRHDADKRRVGFAEDVRSPARSTASPRATAKVQAEPPAVAAPPVAKPPEQPKPVTTRTDTAESPPSKSAGSAKYREAAPIAPMPKPMPVLAPVQSQPHTHAHKSRAEQPDRHSRADIKSQTLKATSSVNPSTQPNMLLSNSLQSLNATATPTTAVGVTMSSSTPTPATLNRIADNACEFMAVELHRPPEGGLGISIEGGRGLDPSLRTTAQGVYVYVVQPRSAGERAGLRVGDKILSVNGTPTAQLSHQQTAALFKAAGPVINLLIARTRSTPLPFGDAPIAAGSDAFVNRSAAAAAAAAAKPPSNASGRSQSQPRVTSSRLEGRPNGDAVRAEENEGETVTGVVRRDEQGGLGLSVITGDERLAVTFGIINGAVYISKIARHGAMERCGKFRLGDRIIAINEVDVTRKSREQTFGLLTGRDPTVRITVFRSRKPFPLAALEPQIISAGRAEDYIVPNHHNSNNDKGSSNDRNNNGTQASPSSAFKPLAAAQAALQHSTSQQQFVGSESARRQHRSVSQFDVKSPIETIVVQKIPNAPIGMSIIGGVDKTCQPFGPPGSGVYISRIARDSPASCTSLRVGDRLLAVGDAALRNVMHDEAKALLRSLHPATEMLLIVEHRPPPAGLRELIIRKRNTSERLGMSIKGGVGERGVNPHDPTDEGIFVWQVHPEGAVQRDGRIVIGMRLLEVNDETLIGVRHAEAVRILKSASNPTRLLVCDGIEPSCMIDDSNEETNPSEPQLQLQSQSQAPSQPLPQPQPPSEQPQVQRSPSSLSSVSAEVANYSMAANGAPAVPPRPPKTKSSKPKASNGSAEQSSHGGSAASGSLPVAMLPAGVLPSGFQLSGQLPANAVVAIPGSAAGMPWQSLVVLMPVGGQQQTQVQAVSDEQAAHAGYQTNAALRGERLNGSGVVASHTMNTSMNSLPAAALDFSDSTAAQNSASKERLSSVSSSSSGVRRNQQNPPASVGQMDSQGEESLKQLKQ